MKYGILRAEGPHEKNPFLKDTIKRKGGKDFFFIVRERA